MLDPTMLLVIGGAVLSLLVVLIYVYFSRDEGDFERAYNARALQLLTEGDRKEKKGGEKPKKNKKKAEKTEKKAAQKKEQEETVESVVEKVEKVVEFADNEVKAVEKEVKAMEEAKKIEDAAALVQTPKKRAPRAVNTNELNQKKLISRLSAVVELEDGYMQYLISVFRDCDHQKNNLTAEVKALHKKLAEANQKIEKANKEKNTAEQREKNEITKKQARESEFAQSLQSAEKTIQSLKENHSKETQLLKAKTNLLEAELQHLKSTNQRLVQKAATPPAQPQNSAENERLREKINDLNGQIQKFEQVAKEMEAHHEKKIGDYLALSQEAAQMEKAISELEESLAIARRELVVQTERETKKDEITRELEEEKKNMEEEYQKLKALVEALNRDVAQFHVYKKEQEQLVGEMKEREAAREQQLSACQKELEAEKSRIVEIPSNSVEAVFELKMTSNGLEIASSSDSGNAEIEKENERLKEKNEELRQRNYTLLEKTADGPKRTVEERKLVVAEVGKLAAGKQFKQFDDEAAYISWIQETVSSSQKKTPEVQKPKVPEGNEGECRKALKSLLTQLETIEKLAEKQEDELRSLKA